MRTYLITTATLFGLMALMHLLRTVERVSQLASDPWFVLGTAAITLVTGGLSVWAWRLLRLAGRT
jgi:hypothetical protein